MAHFAELDSKNIVKQVIVVSNKDTSNDNGIEDESIGIAFLKGLFGDNTIWKQTSYNANFRKYYAGIGYSYREDLDVFVPPSPFPSWILNEIDIVWEPPIPQPELTQEEIDSESFYTWDENVYNENGYDGWVLNTPEEPLESSDT